MKVANIINTVDTHTVGAPTRIVTGGIPPIPGKTMAAKLAYAREHLDGVRTTLMFEPRGHRVMAGAILTEPTTPDADVGVLFMEWGFWPRMCGHSTIGVATALVETGVIPAVGPQTDLVLDTPAGLVPVRVAISDGTATAVTFENVAAFAYPEPASVRTPEHGVLHVDIAYGGNFFAILPASAVGLEIDPVNADQFVKVGARLRKHINEQVPMAHPNLEGEMGCDFVQFTGPASIDGADGRNVVVAADAVDRAPCGTGTSARLALLHARGQLAIGEPYVHEGILGTTYGAIATRETRVGPYRAVITEITGRAYVMGLHAFVVNPDDPHKHGFVLGGATVEQP